ncbi:hypothetical protein RI129_009522 [Pyrocoelia pectoralis]|uniref:Hydroxysteroid dehydrogenase-like protein 2 n=1 Tax=Pyrocoelia pectoralis TaxID=417401 RepID=A0AAN7V299_9COLE
MGLAGKTLFITGGSRGIGKAIALKAARDGANVVIAAKTSEPHPTLPGTIHSAVQEVEAAGGKGLACLVDVRDEQLVSTALDSAAQKFGGIDILINNASAISLTTTEDTPMKRYDLMNNINTRGTFLVSKLCIPFLKKSSNAHILVLSPPLNMNPFWFARNLPYTISKYGMSMCVLGLAEELKSFNVAVNALWPKTVINTAAVQMLMGKESSNNHGRMPEIVADAAYQIFTQDPKPTGQFFIDEDVLKKAGITDFDRYASNPEFKNDLYMDGFIDENIEKMEEGFAKHATLKKETAAPTGGKIPGIFKTIESSLSPKLVEKTQAIYQFVVTGEESSTWFIDLKTGSGACGSGQSPQQVDATLTMDSKHFFAMFSGKMKPATAFMTGKLKISGNMQKALKLDKLMGSLKTKIV